MHRTNMVSAATSYTLSHHVELDACKSIVLDILHSFHAPEGLFTQDYSFRLLLDLKHFPLLYLLM